MKIRFCRLTAARYASFLLFLTLSSFAYSLAITRGPYLQDLTSSSVAVVWVTDSASDSRVDFGLTSSYSNSTSSSAAVTQHQVQLAGLQQASLYHYSVFSNGTQLAGDLTLHSGKGSSFNSFVFVAMGDHRTNPANHLAVAQRVQQIDPEFVIDMGDLTAAGETANWDTEFFTPEKDVMSRAALFPCIGNHEGVAAAYLNNFVLPTASSGTERYYSFDYANAHFTVLDNYTSYAVGSAQYNWLVNDLTNNQSKAWRIVYFHQPPYSSGSHGSDLTVRNTLCPLFSTYKVQIVFNGHDHDYERACVDGVTYIVTGGGGAPPNTVGTNTWTKRSMKTLECCKVAISGNSLTLTTLQPDGTEIDSLALSVPVSVSSFHAE